MTFAAFQKELAQNRFRPAYWFTGNESFLAEAGIKELVEKLIPSEERSLNYVVFYGAEAEGLPETIFSAPIFGQKRVTLVKQAEKLKDRPLAAVVDYLTKPPTDGCLILWSGEEKKKQKRKAAPKKNTKSKKFSDQVPGMLDPVNCANLSDHALGIWMNEYTGKFGKRLHPEALAQLSSINWPSLREVATELEQLILLSGENKEISLGDVQELGGGSFVFEQYTLSNALGSGDRKLANSTLQKMHLLQLDPMQIIGEIYRLINNLWLLRWFIDHKKEAQAGKVIKLHPFVLKKYMSYAGRISRKNLETGLLRLHEADLNIKNGTRSSDLEIRVLLEQMINLTCK